jgi:LacI family gluconate utilization system Gnt-I transcriptional repressor
VLVRAFLSRRIDAIYLTGVIHTPSTVRMLRAGAHPGASRAATSRRSDRHGGRLLERRGGARRHAHLLAHVDGRSATSARTADNDRARDRRRGYESALRAAAARRTPSLCVETTLDIDAGAQAMGRCSTPSRRARGVLLGRCDRRRALFEAQRRGLAIPGRIAIAGFDDMPIAGQVVPALTTLRVPALRHRPSCRNDDLRAAGRPGRQARRVVDTGYELVVRGSA